MLGAAYGVYALVSLALPLSWPSDTHALWSIARFGLVLFPIVLTLAALSTTRWRTALLTLGLDGVLHRLRGQMGSVVLGRMSQRCRRAPVGVGALRLRRGSDQPRPADTQEVGRTATSSTATARPSAALVLYGIVLGVVLLIARGLDRGRCSRCARRRLFAGRRGYVGVGFLAILAVNAVLNPFLHAGKEQGLVPDRWEPSHAGAFAANFVVIVVVAPVVEELDRFAASASAPSRRSSPTWAVVLLVGVAFGAWHGLIIAFPALASLGAIFAFVRVKTRSVYPTMLMHAIFNAGALLIAVTVKVGS